ncbi:MAG: GNAT family N-acetyltransferase [Clostridia bacterium]|nr:GNAT family N-acetyltransferase [Clostridia bacterium]
MNINFREAILEDKEFILSANREINILSGLNDSTLENNIDKDLFKDKVCKSIIVEIDNIPAGFILYSYIYWANCGKGIYMSQAYVKSEYRKQGILKMLLQELETREKECNFITNLVGNENEVMMKSLSKLNFKSSDLIICYRKYERK